MEHLRGQTDTCHFARPVTKVAEARDIQCWSLGLCQRLLEVSNDIVYVFYPNRKSYHVRSCAGAFPLLVGELAMGSGGGMQN